MKNRIVQIAGIFIAVSLSGCFTQSNPDITTAELLEHTSYLASEELAGRFPGTEGDKKAAEYILERFEDYGLDVSSPAGLQEMEVTTSVSIGDSNRLEWKGIDVELMNDFVPMSYTANAECSGELVFIGYGLKTDKGGINWDDFEGVNLKDKVVLILEGGPEEPESGDDPFEGLLSQRSKILMAQDRGAAAVLFVAGPIFDEADKLSFTNIKEAPSGIPAARIARNLANQFLEGVDLLIEDLEKSCQEESQEPIILGQSVSLKTHVIAVKVKTHNVIGILHANNDAQADEYIAIGGHYDHLGMGGPGTGSRVPDVHAVHYGADDNASGTAAVIELAGYFAAKKEEINRSMIFVAFAAEEMGLLGSKYFIENPPVELEKIKAMINIDMIGRLNEEKRVLIGGTGTAIEFDSLLAQVDGGELSLSFSPEGSGPSDHASFYAKDISVLFISTGAHLDYHTPADSIGRINVEGMGVVSSYMAELVGVIGDQEVLNFKVAGPKRTLSTRQSYKVTLGFMPDFTDNSNNGLKVDFPTPGKPAAMAGIKNGDRIIGINGLKVTNIQDYMVRLKSLEPGQIVTVEILREEEKIVLLVQL